MHSPNLRSAEAGKRLREAKRRKRRKERAEGSMSGSGLSAQLLLKRHVSHRGLVRFLPAQSGSSAAGGAEQSRGSTEGRWMDVGGEDAGGGRGRRGEAGRFCCCWRLQIQRQYTCNYIPCFRSGFFKIKVWKIQSTAHFMGKIDAECTIQAKIKHTYN